MAVETTHIFLDRLYEEMLPKMLSWRNDIRIRKWCRQNDIIDEIHHKEWYENQSKDESIRMYSIMATGATTGKKDPDVIGICGLTDIDLINQRAEFSIYVGPEFGGNNYGELALKLLCANAFDSYPLHTVWGEVFDGNPALEVFKKIGFKVDGIRRDFYFREGKFLDAHLISIKRGELIND